MLTIVRPAESHRLTTLAVVKGELRLTGGADDAYLAGLVDQASAAVRTWCGRTFAAEAVREAVDAPRSAGLMLSRWPVVSIEAVTVAGLSCNPALFEADESGTFYRLDGAGQRIGWCFGRIVVEYTAGFILPGKPGRTLPEDIERATLTLVKAEFFARTRDPLIRSEDVNGAVSTAYQVGGFGSSLPPDVEGLLSRHRQVSIG